MATEMETSELTQQLATQYKVPVGELVKTVKAICFPSGAASDAQLFVFLNAARKLDLDPLNKEIYAFVSSGKLQVIVGFDGWIKLATRNAQFAGFEFFDVRDEKGAIVAVTCKMYRKDWKVAGEATEYLSECKGNTDPWNKWPHRMLRNKAYIQCARMTFGFAEAIDPDEAERIANGDNWPSNGDGAAPAIETTATKIEEKPSGGSSQPDQVAGAASAEASPPAEPASTGGDSTKKRGRPRKVELVRDPLPTAAAAAEPAAPTAAVNGATGIGAGDLQGFVAAHNVPQARLDMALTKAGVERMDQLTPEQSATILEQFTKSYS
ncbi:MAG: RecT family recombinase [Methylocella sp.]